MKKIHYRVNLLGNNFNVLDLNNNRKIDADEPKVIETNRQNLTREDRNELRDFYEKTMQGQKASISIDVYKKLLKVETKDGKVHDLDKFLFNYAQSQSPKDIKSFDNAKFTWSPGTGPYFEFDVEY